MSNLTGRPVVPKGQRLKKKPNLPSAAQVRYRERVRKLGCILRYFSLHATCRSATTIHHLYTGAGGRKDHDKIGPLCVEHHLGDEGINSLSGKISRPKWEQRFVTEQEIEAKVKELLG